MKQWPTQEFKKICAIELIREMKDGKVLEVLTTEHGESFRAILFDIRFDIRDDKLDMIEFYQSYHNRKVFILNHPNLGYCEVIAPK